jgi:rhodanese-related sulfurtransferase
MQHFNAIELQHYLTQAHPILLDVREPWEFKVCHLEGAQLLPMREIPSKFNMLDPQQEIVVICHHGIRSRQVGYFLESNGFTRVINLSGGMAAWARDVDPQMAVY